MESVRKENQRQVQDENAQFLMPIKQASFSVQKQAFGELKNVLNSAKKKEGGHFKGIGKNDGGTPSCTPFKKLAHAKTPILGPSKAPAFQSTPLGRVSPKPHFKLFEDGADDRKGTEEQAPQVPKPELQATCNKQEEAPEVLIDEMEFFDLIDSPAHTECRNNDGQSHQLHQIWGEFDGVDCNIADLLDKACEPIEEPFKPALMDDYFDKGFMMPPQKTPDVDSDVTISKPKSDDLDELDV